MPSIQQTAKLMQEIAAASDEQSHSTAQVNQAVQQLDKVIQQNAASSEEMASAANSLSAEAERLRQTMEFFKLASAGRASTANPDYVSAQGMERLKKIRSRFLSTRGPDQGRALQGNAAWRSRFSMATAAVRGEIVAL